MSLVYLNSIMHKENEGLGTFILLNYSKELTGFIVFYCWRRVLLNKIVTLLHVHLIILELSLF